METVTVSPKFQVVIPKGMREALKLTPGQKVQALLYENRIELIPVRPVKQMRGFLKGMAPELITVRDYVAWSYANLCRAHAATEERATRYSRVHHGIRARFFQGFVQGKISMRSLVDDEQVKLQLPKGCCYCGDHGGLALDHLIPRIRGGEDSSDNIVWACRSCNSSKQGRDMMVWMRARNSFPSLLLLRRYLKLVARHCERLRVMDDPFEDAAPRIAEFDLRALPFEQDFPTLGQMVEWVKPQRTSGRRPRVR